ncbi:reverse transcriptase/maturase family protein [Chryseobacterium jejuense]|uniref:Group II intron-encoded protein ltrA n=1 Tax=Chryseobacterium jejuense TaxID=445960 RepID=A0A2X2XPD5_CHRJE|nr:reverse transcriptase/maturase family protein [Chryseobacterium jejuense]SDI84196.1 Reverse transcriptase (RNA-dependent DNA polymerase) [Chryseobacterium jejuense]SQB27649.1 Group II intron-encoded protein ltrA [Chryseobacterium jejuense]
MLQTYFSEEEILTLICKIRAKIAKQRSKKHLIHLLSSDNRTNYHLNHKKNQDKTDEDLDLLNSILPPRRKWKTLKKKRRYITNYQKIDSIKNNADSLFETIRYYKEKHPNELFIINLNKFVKDIQDSILNTNFCFTSPKIIPLSKKDQSKCRPIALYNLKDRIIISLTNKYLSEYFDEHFFPESHAFRPKRIYKGKKVVTSHHHAMDSILKYKSDYKGKKLYVSECDISKFYDSVNHTIVKECFKKLISQSNLVIDSNAKRIFYKYLESYSFVHNVKIYNHKKYSDYWQQYKIDNGYFGWIDDDLKDLKYYKSVNHNRVGVPQGGAISGLIANMVLHFADLELLKKKDSKLHYVRFCDDMVIIHPNKKQCEDYYQVYNESLKKLKLVPHLPLNFNFNNKQILKEFWSEDTKSKSPYRWSGSFRNSTKWIGFVGYEVSFNNEIRVRKRSLKKEKLKQQNLIDLTLRSLKKGQRKSKDTIIESVCNRLVGMSVGRVNIKNYAYIENDFCWAKGFNRLSKNNHIARQLKNLDRCRNKQIARLKKELSNANNKKDVFIPKFLFSCIPKVSIFDSIIIRDELVSLKVLSSKFKLTSSMYNKINETDFKLQLSNKYINKERIILKTLISYKNKERNVNYYGKPFSYYFHLLEKQYS